MEQHHARVRGVRAVVAAVADADVRGPVPHEPQSLGPAGGAPDHARLLGERQEVAAVEDVHDHRRDPPQRGDREACGGPPHEPSRVAPGHGADRRLIHEQCQRRQRQPGDHSDVDAATGRARQQRERGGPPPAARVAQAAVDGQQHPRQQRVREQRDRRPVREHDDVRVQQDHGTGGEPCHGRARPARRGQQRLGEAGDADRRHGEHGAQPQPVHEPLGQPGEAAEREERAHREQVAGVLAAVDVAEVAGRGPDGRDVGEESDRIHVEVDLRVRGRPSRALPEAERERERSERELVSAHVKTTAGHRAPPAYCRSLRPSCAPRCSLSRPPFCWRRLQCWPHFTAGTGRRPGSSRA